MFFLWNYLYWFILTFQSRSILTALWFTLGIPSGKLLIFSPSMLFTIFNGIIWMQLPLFLNQLVTKHIFGYVFVLFYKFFDWNSLNWSHPQYLTWNNVDLFVDRTTLNIGHISKSIKHHYGLINRFLFRRTLILLLLDLYHIFTY